MKVTPQAVRSFVDLSLAFGLTHLGAVMSHSRLSVLCDRTRQRRRTR